MSAAQYIAPYSVSNGSASIVMYSKEFAREFSFDENPNY
jgi:hypothetical protein